MALHEDSDTDASTGTGTGPNRQQLLAGGVAGLLNNIRPELCRAIERLMDKEGKSARQVAGEVRFKGIARGWEEPHLTILTDVAEIYALWYNGTAQAREAEAYREGHKE